MVVLINQCYAFFFQAEDGIRDLTVTGVQTCALPICRRHAAVGPDDRVQARAWFTIVRPDGCVPPTNYPNGSWLGVYRSEERRVGKECRVRWAENKRERKGGASVMAGCMTER